MPVQISFKLGHHGGVIKGSAEAGLNMFINGLEDLATDQVVDALAVDVPAMQARLDRTVSRSMQAAINYARLNIMGTMSASGSQLAPTQIYFELTGGDDGAEPLPRSGASYIKMNQSRLRGADKIEWEPLSTKTRLTKMKSGLSRNDALRHYVHTGALRKELGELAKSITQSTGTVRIGYIKNKAKRYSLYQARQPVVRAGRLQLTFLPKVPLNHLPGLKSGNPSVFDRLARFEKSLPISKESKQKLEGWSQQGRSVHRPLLQPIMTYWLLNKTPSLIEKAIARSLIGK